MPKNDYTKSPWKHKRREIISRDHGACARCGSEGVTLSVHHKYYVTHRKIEDYPPFALTAVCKTCHSNAHSAGNDVSEFELLIDAIWDGNEEDFDFQNLSTLITERIGSGKITRKQMLRVLCSSLYHPEIFDAALKMESLVPRVGLLPEEIPPAL